MRHTVILLLSSLLAMPAVAEIAAAEAEVTFKEPEKYTDIRPAADTRARFQERVLKQFEGFFKDMATQLPEGYKWQVTVTDIDLAGDVDPFIGRTGQPIRVVKDIYSPAVRFSYTLHDATGTEVAAGDERLRDMSFMQRTSTLSRNTEFEYEKRMLNEWFSKNLLPKVKVQADPEDHSHH
ncbi:DUF3016 domain-containing protein [Chromatiaceae bacterium AAb-1]|nr:DUF3016 domain-containing protein [Chromatiaceae bacterium AAb-1]